MKPAIRKFAVLTCIGAALASCQSADVLESASTSSQSSLDASVLPEPRRAPEQAPATAVMEPAPANGVPTEGQESRAAIAALPGVEDQQRIPSGQPSPSAATSSPGQTTVMAAIDPQSGVLAGVPGTIVEPAETPAEMRPKKTFLINGLLSAVPFIGYGFRNLHKKMPEAEIYSYMGVVEGPAIIAPKVVKEAEAAWRANPDTMINLIGISLGADLVTVIANQLKEKGVPVNYLGIVDGTNLQPIPANVRKADNLTCSYLDCTKARARLATGNSSTIFEKKVYQSSHIPLGNHDGLHARVIQQSNSL